MITSYVSHNLIETMSLVVEVVIKENVVAKLVGKLY